MIHPLTIAKTHLLRVMMTFDLSADEALEKIKKGFDYMDGPIKRTCEPITNKNAVDWFTKASELLTLK
jgi:hypothetical protein